MSGQAEAEAEARDWAELPQDALATVLGKLRQAEILSWRRRAADEPAMWRRVKSNYRDGLPVARLALKRSAGRCEEFMARGPANDGFLLDLAEHAPSLKSLRLVLCYHVSQEGFAEAIKKFPMLEELELSLCIDVFGKEAFETVGKACPQLKRFRLIRDRFRNFEARGYNKDGDALGIATMTELISLHISGNDLTNKGMTAILDNCPHLESLEIGRCCNVNMDDFLQAKCARIKTVQLLGEFEGFAPDPGSDSDFIDYDFDS